jgi:hypothetical protein
MQKIPQCHDRLLETYTITDKRLMKYLIALAISFLGTFSSYYFLRPEYQLPNNDEHRVAVALIEFQDGQSVQKMSAGQAFWLDVKTGAELYEGDSVRTLSSSNAKVKFLGTDTILNIQPDTRFIVEKKENKIVVGDIEGDLFVENTKAISDVQFKSGGKTFDVADGQAKISVQDGEVDLALKGAKVTTSVNGQEKILSGEQSAKMTDQGIKEKQVLFKHITPYFDESIYNEADKDIVKLEWDDLVGNFDYTILIGNQKKNLSPILEQQIFKKEKNALWVKLNRGNYYWKITGKNIDDEKLNVVSDVFQFTHKTKFLPEIVYPSNDAKVSLAKEAPNRSVKFEWKSNSPLSQTFLEISKDPQFTKIIFSDVTSNNFYNFDPGEGEFYWRLTAFYEKSKTISKIQAGKFTAKYFDRIFPPDLVMPTDKKEFLLASENDMANINLSWKSITQANKYKILVKSIKSKEDFFFEKEVNDSYFQLQNLTEGLYEWQAASIDTNGTQSELTPKRTFSIKKPSRIEWSTQNDLFEYINRPEIELSWIDKSGVNQWKLEYAIHPDLKDANQLIVSTAKTKLPLSLPGQYYIKVSALNNQGERVGSSSLKMIKVQEKPKPQAPKFSDNLPTRLVASSSGQIAISFKPLLNDKDKIILKFIDQNGETVKLHRLKNTSEVIQSLLPGNYRMIAQVEDEFDRRSEPSDPRELEVPAISSLQAPIIERINVR